MKELNRIISPDTQRKDRLPPGQRMTEKWPVLHYGKVPTIDNKAWTFTIAGLVEAERTLTHKEFTSLPHVEVFSDIHCVTTWSRYNNLWEGISTTVIKDIAGIRGEAKYVMGGGAGGFTTNLSLEGIFQ